MLELLPLDRQVLDRKVSESVPKDGESLEHFRGVPVEEDRGLLLKVISLEVLFELGQGQVEVELKVAVERVILFVAIPS